MAAVGGQKEPKSRRSTPVSGRGGGTAGRRGGLVVTSVKTPSSKPKDPFKAQAARLYREKLSGHTLESGDSSSSSSDSSGSSDSSSSEDEESSSDEEESSSEEETTPTGAAVGPGGEKIDSNWEEQSYVTRCACGFTHNDEFMIQCDVCQ